MSWKDIPGRAAYLWIYDDFLASNPRENAKVVEVGVALGKSISYLVDKVIRAGRDDISVYAVDAWAGVDRNGEQQAMSSPNEDYELFIRMMREHCPVELAEIIIRRGWSVDESKKFKDNSVDLVVLDAAHDYENVRTDLHAWIPKIRNSGYIGGDDYVDDYPGLKKALHEVFDSQELEIRHDLGWGTWRVRI